MEKLVYLLWPDTEDEGWPDRLRGAVATQLLDTGVRGLQVNVDDRHVAAAMLRINTFDAPVVSVIGVWVDTVAGAMRTAVEQILAAASSRIAGYLVTESVPTAAPPCPLGTRAAGFSNMALLRRPVELAPELWLDRWQNHHTAVAIETQDTFGYLQNVVVRAITPGAPQLDGIVEEMFRIEALDDVHAFYGSGGDQDELDRRLSRMMASVATFGADQNLDVVPSSRYVLRPARADG